MTRGQKSAKTKGYRPLVRAPVCRANRRLPVDFRYCDFVITSGAPHLTGADDQLNGQPALSPLSFALPRSFGSADRSGQTCAR